MTSSRGWPASDPPCAMPSASAYSHQIAGSRATLDPVASARSYASAASANRSASKSMRASSTQPRPSRGVRSRCRMRSARVGDAGRGEARLGVRRGRAIAAELRDEADAHRDDADQAGGDGDEKPGRCWERHGPYFRPHYRRSARKKGEAPRLALARTQPTAISVRWPAPAPWCLRHRRLRARGLLHLDRVVEDLDAVLRRGDRLRERFLREIEVVERRAVHGRPPFPVGVRVAVLRARRLERVLGHADELRLAELRDQLRQPEFGVCAPCPGSARPSTRSRTSPASRSTASGTGGTSPSGSSSGWSASATCRTCRSSHP